MEDTLNIEINDAQNDDDLLPILKCVAKNMPMNKLKNILRQQMNEMTPESLRNVYFNASSINKLIPEDIIQYILSFHSIGLQSVKLVNKKWNQLSTQNDNIYIPKALHMLHKNSVSKIINNASFEPHLQIIHIKPLSTHLGETRIRVVLSDGENCIFGMLASEFNSLVNTNKLNQYAIIHLKEFVCCNNLGKSNSSVCVLVNFDILQRLNQVIGDPIYIGEKTSKDTF